MTKDLGNINMGKVLAETVDLVGLKTTHAIVHAGYMDMGQAGMRKQFKEMERIEVVRAPSASPVPTLGVNDHLVCFTAVCH